MPNIQDITAAQGSEQSGIPKRTILAAITRGELRARKLGSASYVIKQRDFDRWVAKREQNNGAA